MGQYSELRKHIGRNLQNARKKAGFRSAKAFADALGMSTASYTDYEQGRTAMSYERAWQIADVLNCSLDELGGRNFQPAAYSDPRQQALNHSYSLLDEKSKGDLAGIASTFTADPSRRAAKSGQGTEPVVEGEGAA